MNHEEARLLSAFIDGELTARERAAVETHLPVCASCRFEAESLRLTKRLLSSAPRRAMPPDLIAAIEQSASRPSLARWLPVLSRPQVFVPTAALAAASLIVGFWLSLTSNDPDQYVPLEPLLAAHARYQAEALVPEENMVAASYSSQLNSTAEAQDQGQE